MKSILNFKRAGATLIAVGLLGLAGVAVAVVSSFTTEGTWVLYPGQSSIYRVAVQQPINADGTSVFNSRRGVVPIKFALESAVGPAYLPSIHTDSDPDNDFGFASFTTSTVMTFAEITNLDVEGAFDIGANHGGSLRWQVRVDMDGDGVVSLGDKNIFIYYGDYPSFGNDGAVGFATGDLIEDLDLRDDLRFDTAQITGGTFYDSYDNAVALAGANRVLRMSLIVDSGWQSAIHGGDQLYRLDSATVNDNLFTPEPSTGFTPATVFPEAEVQIIKVSGSNSGLVNEPITIQSADNNGLYRVVDHRYMYNLDVSSLTGAGVYRVYVVINGVPAENYAQFELK